MKTTVNKTGLCIFIMLLPIITTLLVCLGSAVLSSVFVNEAAILILCSFIPLCCVIFIAVYLFRCGTALFSLIIIARVKNEEGMNKEELETLTLKEFIRLSRTPIDEEEKDASLPEGDDEGEDDTTEDKED